MNIYTISIPISVRNVIVFRVICLLQKDETNTLQNCLLAHYHPGGQISSVLAKFRF